MASSPFFYIFEPFLLYEQNRKKTKNMDDLKIYWNDLSPGGKGTALENLGITEKDLSEYVKREDEPIGTLKVKGT